MTEQANSRILIVEDENIVAMDIQKRLERLGYGVAVIASSGEEAVEAVGWLAPDLVLMDIKLRGDMDGTQAAEQIRDRFNIPVIYLTAYTDDATLNLAKITEPYGYIVKPFGDRVLHSTINMALYKHKAEQALKESEERYRTIFDGSRDAIFITAEDAGFVEVNEAALALTGYSREELKKMAIPDLHEEKDTHAYEQFFHRIMSGEQITSEARILRKDRTKVDTEFSNRRITIGDVPYMHTVARDITERKKAESALLESEKSYRSVVENAGEGIVVVQDTMLRFVNPQFKSVIGYSEEELTSRPFIEFVHPDDREQVMGIYAKRLKGEEVPRTYEFRAVDKQGNTKWIENNGILIEWSGRPATLNFLRDITERKKAEELLQLERDNFINILDSMEDGVCIVDRNHNTQYVNPLLKKDFGPYEGRKCYEYFHDRREVCPWCKGEEVFVGKTVRWEWYSFKNQRTYDLIDTPLRNPDGSISKLEIFRDISDRRKAEEAVRNERDKARKYLDIAAVMLVAIDVEGRVSLINKKGCEILGYKEEEIIGKKWFDNFLPERIRKEVRTVFKKLMAGNLEPVEYFEKPIITKDGNERLIAWHNTLLRAEQGDIIGTMSSGEDITERKQAEEKLRESEERLTKAFQASPNLMGIIDLDERRRLLVNEAFARITGYNIEEVTGTTFDELSFWVEPDRVHEALRFVAQDGTLQDYEADIRTKQGEIRTLRYHGALLDIPGKNLVMFSAEDITEQREAERRIKEYQAQLKSLASELSLVEERERRRIATGIHDDIAQKLAMAKFELQSLQASVTDTDVSESLGKQCQLMDQVVADARSLTFELSNPVLYQVGLEVAVESYLTERIQGQFGIKCKFKSEGPRSSLEENIRIVLFQAVRELLTNIVKHANASTIEVCVSNTEDRLRIVVQDDGVGFDPTETGPHQVGRGGFGLFNIRERLEYLGGNVKIESRRKKGARVTMTVAMRTDTVAE